MVRYTLRQCTYFRAVAEHGGIAQAARALNISQPSVAQALDKLEAVTGLALFDRHHARGLTLTLQGRVFLEHVTRLEELAQQVEREASALAAEAAGEIRLGVFWTLAPFYAARLINSFADIAPGVIIRLREMSLTDLADALREGSIDLALTYDRGAEPDGLAFVELAALRPMVVLAANHPLAGRRSINLSDLAAEPYVMFDGPGSRSYFEGLLEEIGVSPRISYVSTSLESVRSAVAAGFGFTLLVMRPPSSVTYDGGRVKTLKIDNEVRPLRVVLASRGDAHRGLILRRFADHAVDYFASCKTTQAS
ncbi:LysR family transcriptional regulator [Ancylobacter vacuolatus]|uniref:DNA-binding transcriptional LysR family regulator n=1 Tax=Ancylobacter vacuolatus TaxID=223389 RepID=A0ABU0DP75_9HYPH|nr:LysR family transcriptional regulator [Ancylobacter vacuolatus]MDQ0350111.1 DNA-binding transcriptional LysR family regulator [Ancylobacter vacuolatus]